MSPDTRLESIERIPHRRLAGDVVIRECMRAERGDFGVSNRLALGTHWYRTWGKLLSVSTAQGGSEKVTSQGIDAEQTVICLERHNRFVLVHAAQAGKLVSHMTGPVGRTDDQDGSFTFDFYLMDGTALNTIETAPWLVVADEGHITPDELNQSIRASMNTARELLARLPENDADSRVVLPSLGTTLDDAVVAIEGMLDMGEKDPNRHGGRAHDALHRIMDIPFSRNLPWEH